MTIALTSPVTGSAQTGLTSPTYTIVEDTAPDVNAKQWVITALGGTQTGVTANSGSSPFTISFSKPKRFAAASGLSGSGVYSSLPVNRFGVIVRKGAVTANGDPRVVFLRVSCEVPATTDTVSPAELRAGMSLLLGALAQVSASLGDLIVSNVL